MPSLKQMIPIVLFLSYFYVSSDAKSCTDYAGECASASMDFRRLQCRGKESCTSSDIAARKAFCSGMNSCQSTTLDASSNIVCSGYRACQYAEQVAANDVDIECSSYESCKDMDKLVVTNGNCQCTNYQSCADVNEITSNGEGKLVFSGHMAGSRSTIVSNEGSSIKCNGANGCYQAKLSAIGSDNELLCYGHNGCAMTTITKTQNIQALGGSGIKQAMIDSEGLSVMNVDVFGWMAGYFSTIRCRAGTVCNIRCKGNACWHLVIVYYGAREDVNVECDGQNNVICPAILPIVDYKDEMIDNPQNTDSDSEIRDESELQTDSSDIVCDESSTSSPCFDTMLTESENIFCNGLKSCAQSQLTAQGYKYIRCLGDEACSGAVSLSAFGIVCAGPKSCVEVEQFIMELNHASLECSGLLACSEIDLIDSDMSNGMVHCSGDQSCKGAQLTDIKGLNCDGIDSCREATITEVSGDISCQTRGCYAATITAGGVVRAFGHLAAAQSTITVPSLVATGYRSLAAATIDTHGLAQTMIYMHGFEAGDGATLHCRDGTDCSVECAGNACNNFDIFCYDGSECTLTCCTLESSGYCSPARCACDGSENIDCPNYVDVSTMDVIANEVLSVNDAVKYDNAMWQLTPTVAGALLIGLFAFVALTYLFYAKWNAKEYQIIQ